MSRAPRFPLGRPLSWLQLTSDRKRFAAAIGGTACAVAMILIQLGFDHALFSRAVLLHERLRTDLVLISRDYNFIVAHTAFPRERLHQALGDEAVAGVSPFFATRRLWRHPETHLQQMIVALAFPPDDRPLELPELGAGAAVLKRTGSVLFDAKSRREFGPVAERLAREGPFYAEVNSHRVRVEGLFALGPTFAVDGNVAMSEETYFMETGAPPRELVNVGLVRLRPGADAAAARARLEARLPRDVQVLTKAGFAAMEKSYWMRRTPIGFVTKASVFVALVVGAAVVYQILYTDVSEHLPEYATLKAIGFSDRFFARLVLEQAAILALAGFGPGVVAATALGEVAAVVTNLPLRPTPERLAGVLLLTVLMGGSAGLLALRRLRQARPAEVF